MTHNFRLASATEMTLKLDRNCALTEEGAGAIDVGNSHSCAVILDHTVYCWGLNSSGQLGNDTVGVSSVPVLVPEITDADSVSAGSEHTCARLLNGRIKCWGANDRGQFGDGSNTDSAAPVEVLGVSDAINVAVEYSTSCAMR